jgi:glycosyltransferase involved in cell wall biosynthesis
MQNFKITIITVVFNDVKNIKKTIESVLSQSYTNIEYLIFDGKSTDGTIDIIKKYSDRIGFWQSEKDNGIYDVMNKAIDKASGDYAIFLNSADLFFSNFTIEDCQSKIFDSDVLYGSTKIFLKDKILKPHSTNKDWKLIPYCHQSVFIRLSLLKKVKFNLKYLIASDYNQYFELKKLNAKFKETNDVISIYDVDGFSSHNYKQLLTEYQNISLSNHDFIIDRIKIIIHFFLKKIISS